MHEGDVVERYHRDGYVVVPGLMTADRVTDALEQVRRRPLPGSGLVAFSPDHDPEVELGRAPELVELAATLLGGAVELFGYSIIVKRARTGPPALWHQDGHPWRERWGIEQAVTLWVALDPAGPEAGGLRFIPGSHGLPVQPLRPNTETPNVFGWESDPAMVDEAAAVDVVLEPGDVSAHHPALLHASWPNRSEHRRAALSVRYRAV